MNWLVYLSGDDSLMEMISKSIPEIMIRPGPEGRYAFLFESSEDLFTEEEIRGLAEERAALIRGISILVLNDDPCMGIDEICRTEKVPGDFQENQPSAENRDIIISCDEGDDEEILVGSPFESVYIAAAAEESLGAVIMEMSSNFGKWGGFLRIYRDIESYAGNPVDKGWCSDDELEWFLYSAGAKDSGVSYESTGPMYLSEAESFITILMQEWIKEKKRELDI